MPVRKIPKSHQNITGQISSQKSIGPAGFESSLERDFLILLDFNCFVEKFEVQPCKIDFLDTDGKKRTYTPDVLAFCYLNNTKQIHKVLYEVKYRQDLQENWLKWKPKFKAAYRYALSKRWKFKIITDKEIRTPYLQNAKFLRNYNTPIDDSRLATAYELMTEWRESDPSTLIAALASDLSNRIEVTYLIWQMIARGHLKTDLTLPLNMNSKIWL